MMLAMGHYSALQSFEPVQVKNPRDLPPTGPRPLWDVLWVATHPDYQRTDRILSTYDVRYIVLYKNMPDRPTQDYWFSSRTTRTCTGRPSRTGTYLSSRGDDLPDKKQAQL